LAQESFGEWDLTVPQLQQIVDNVREEVLRPGDRVPGWDRGGANPDAELRAAGADSHWYRIRGSDGDAVGILDGRSIASLAPQPWRVVDTYGSAATEVDNPLVQFQALSPRYVVALRAGSERRRDADCISEIANATLYERPNVPPSEADDSVRLFFRVMLLVVEGQTLCTRYQSDGEGGYLSLSFLPDGRALPTLNEHPNHLTIIPAGSVEQLVTYTAVDGAT
jgi:hypothetical protein